MTLGKDGLANSIGDVVPNVGAPLQAGGPLLPRGEAEMLIKVIHFSLHIFPGFKTCWYPVSKRFFACS